MKDYWESHEQQWEEMMEVLKMRYPLKRNEYGQYKVRLPGIDEYAKEVAQTLADRYKEVSTIDIEYQFVKEVTTALMLVLMEEKAEAEAEKENKND